MPATLADQLRRGYATASTTATRHKNGRLAITFVDPAGVKRSRADSLGGGDLRARELLQIRFAHDSADGACANAAVWTIIRIALADPTIPDRSTVGH
jgi:hypothetical protein